MTPRQHSFGANAVLSAVSWMVPAIAALIAIPITINGLGKDQYGLLVLTAAVTSYLGIMEMGLGSAVMRYLSYHRTLDQGRPMLGILRFAVFWFCVAGVIGGASLWMAAPWVSSAVLRVPPDLVQTSITALRLTSVNFVLAMLVSVGAAIPQSFLRYDLHAAISGSIGLLSAAGPAVIVSLGYELVPVILFSLTLNACAVVVYAIVTLRLMRQVSLSEGPEWKQIRREVLSFAGLTALNRIGHTVSAQTNRFVVGIAIGVAAAGYYQVPSVVASRVNQLLSRVAMVIFPTASALFANDDTEGVRRLYLRTSRLFFVVNFSVSVGLCVLSYPLLQHWISSKPEYAEEGWVALGAFAVSQSLHACTMAASYVNLSAARPGINAVFSNTSYAINLALVYPLTVHLGVTGAALSGLVAALNVPFFLHYSHRHVLQLPSWSVWRRCYQPTVLGAGLTAIPGYFLLRPLCSNLPVTLAAWGLMVCASMAVSGLLGAIRKEDIATSRRLAHSFWRRLVAAVTR